MASLLNQLLAPKLELPLRPKIAEGSSCPKCGYLGKADASEPEAMDWRQYTWVAPWACERFNFVDENGRPLRECLMISCGRCGYRYREDVRTPEPGEVKPS